MTLSAGRCSETLGPAEPFLPFYDAVGRLLTSPGRDVASGLLRTHAPTICVQMPAGLLPDPDGALHRQTAGATKERLIREAGDFMEAACRIFPILLLVEDLQWADPASVDLLHHVGCRLARQRTLIVGTFRQADVDAGNPLLKRCATDLLARGAARELALGALTEENLEAYLETRFPGHRFPPALAPALHARTEGLALFVRSLVDILAERRDVVQGNEGWTLARPVEELDLEPTKGLQELVRHQLEGLAPPEREILDVASVCGREFLSPVIAHLVGRPDRQVEEDLRRLGRVRRLIVEGGEETLPDGTLATRYRFAHGLYRSVLREDLVASRRIEIHREVATRLLHHWGTEAPRIATEIARHCEEGRDPGRAVTFRGHAGDNAARLYAYAEAEEHYEWAFRSFEKLPAESRPAAAIALHRRRGTVRLAQARFDDATADFEAMLAVARGTGAPGGELAALAGLCDALFYGPAGRGDGRPRAGAARRRPLERAGPATAPRPTRGSARPSSARGASRRPSRCWTTPSRPPGESARRWRSRSRSATAASCTTGRPSTRPPRPRCVEALSLATGLGDGFYALAERMFLGLARANLGRISEALDDFTDAMAMARRNDDRYWLPRLMSHLGWVHRELGALERAREHDTEAVRLARERPAWGPESEVLLNLCVDNLREGQAERASALLAELEARAAGSSWMRWMNELRLAAAAAEHWAVRGDHERTLEHAAGWRRWRSASARATTAAPPSGSGPSRPSRSGEGIADAATRLAAALGELQGRPAPLEAWKSARLLAIARRRLGDEEGARAAFAQAAGAVRTIADGTRDEGLRNGFLALPLVREVLEA